MDTDSDNEKSSLFAGIKSTFKYEHGYCRENEELITKNIE